MSHVLADLEKNSNSVTVSWVKPMAVGLSDKLDLLPIPGIRLSAVHAGIRYQNRKELLLIELADTSRTAAVFTQNRFCAAPVIVAKEHLAQSSPRYLLINAGNANAGTGDLGEQNARKTCDAVATISALSSTTVLPFSTGVIGEQLPVDKITHSMQPLFDSLNEDAWQTAAHAIMTTDTVPKGLSRQVEVDGVMTTVTGIVKGSGMIHPDMATMLAYIATDAEIDQSMLDQKLSEFVETSFNSITVDGDTSTNDACLLMATGKAGVDASNNSAFWNAVSEVFFYLAQAIIRDAEGATKFVQIDVTQAANNEDAKVIAYTVANSPLVKTALFASDPNWGRILAAVGRAKVAELDLAKVDISLGNVSLIEQGQPAKDYTEAAGQAVMDEAEIQISINLHQSTGGAIVWTSDLSHGYVQINADYRS